jgi:putative sigma-54 modulation protein
MRIDVIGRNLDITDAIREHAESKCAKLTKYFDGVQQITVRLEKEDHHQHGLYGVELVVEVVKHEDFISTAHGEDLYAIIDQVTHKGVRQLTDYKEKLRDTHR